MRTSNLVKTVGYLVSTISVILLGIVAWKSASSQPLLAACLVLGMLTSTAGMLLRWISYQIQEREEKKE